VLFDTLGWSDRAWSRRLGAASWELLYHAITMQLSAGQSLIAESNFRHDLAAGRIGALLSRYSAGLLQVVCTADPETLMQRYRARTETGQRHPGHVDDLESTQAEYATVLAAAHDWSVSHDAATRVVDTTNPASIDYDTLVAACQASILRSR
jgi:predicted kinase